MSSRNLRLAPQVFLYCVCLYSNSCAHVHGAAAAAAVFASRAPRGFDPLPRGRYDNLAVNWLLYSAAYSQKGYFMHPEFSSYTVPPPLGARMRQAVWNATMLRRVPR